MRFLERLQVALNAFGDGMQASWDLLASPFDESDQEMGDILGLLGRAAKGYTYGLGNTAMAIGGSALEVVGEVSDTAVDVVTQPFRTYQTAINLSNSPTWWKEQGYSTASNALAKNPQSYASMLDPDTWSKAWEVARTTSLGQSGWRGFKWDGKQVDILDPEAVQKLQDDPLFNVASGLTDAAVSWYADPIAASAKVYSVGKKVSNTYGLGTYDNDSWLEKMLHKRGVGARETDPDKFANSDAVNEFLAWADGKSARDILRHPMIQGSSRKDDFAGVIAGLLDGVDQGTARQVIAAAFGSRKAYDDIAKRDASLAFRMNQVREADNPMLDRELRDRIFNTQFQITGALNRFATTKDLETLQDIQRLNPADPEYHQSLKAKLLDHDQNQKNIYNAILGQYDGASGLLSTGIKQVPKVGMSRKADRHIAYETGDYKKYLNSANFPQAVNHLIQPKAFGMPIRVIGYFPFKAAQSFTNKRPPSWIDPNRDDSTSGLVSFMKHATPTRPFSNSVFSESEIGRYTNEYINALDVKGRVRVAQMVERDAMKKIALAQGYPLKAANFMAMAANGRRNNLIQNLRGGKAGKTFWLDPDGNKMDWPLFETQEVNAFPFIDLEEYARVLQIEKGGLMATMYHSPIAFTNRVFDVFTGFWSASQLLRIGYGMRNITDAALRLVATMGAMGFLSMAAAGVRANPVMGVAARLGNTDKRLGALASAAASTSAMVGNKALRKAGQTFDPDLVEWAQLRDTVLARMDKMGRDLDTVTTQSALGIEYKGVNHVPVFFGKSESYRVLASSSFQNLAKTRDGLLKDLRNKFNSNDIINPKDRGHLEEWAHIANNVIGKSELARRYFEGRSFDEVRSWLTKGKGTNIMRRIGGPGRVGGHATLETARAVAGEAMAVVDTYVPLVPGPQPDILRRLAYEGKLTPKILEEYFPNVDTRPQVWNAQISFNLREGAGYKLFNKMTSTAFKMVAQMPEDKLIRNPAFRQMVIGNTRMLHERLERELGHANFTNLDVERISHQAHQMSLKQMKRTLYEGDITSNIAHRFRMLTAFFPAWEDSIMKWGRIVTDDPSVLIQGGKLWNAPSDMGLGATYDPETGEMVPRFQVVVPEKNEKGEPTGGMVKAPRSWDIWSMNEEAFIEVRLPEWLSKKIPGNVSDTWRVSKPSMNLILQGESWWLPGAGPLTAIATSKLALAYPTTLTDVYKWAIPFGPEDDAFKSLAPAWVRRMWESGESINDESYAYAFLNIAMTEIRRAKEEGRNRPSDQVFYDEIKDRTDKFYKLRSFVNFVAPFSVQAVSPYQFYIDEYRKLRSADPDTADETFLANHGDDFYMFATSLSKNNTGLPASKRMWELSEKNRDLIAKDPEMARIYLADVPDEVFDQYVYAAQFRQKFDDLGELTGRSKQNPLKALEDNQKKLGWIKYTKVMDYIDGLEEDPNADREMLAAFRSYMGIDIARENRPFAEDFLKTDPEKIPVRIEKMKQLVQEKSLQGRPEIRQLTKYLMLRQGYLDRLRQRYTEGGEKTLRAESNHDLLTEWKAVKEALARENTLFGRNIYHRFLANDYLQTSRLEVDQ